MALLTRLATPRLPRFNLYFRCIFFLDVIYGEVIGGVKGGLDDGIPEARWMSWSAAAADDASPVPQEVPTPNRPAFFRGEVLGDCRNGKHVRSPADLCVDLLAVQYFRDSSPSLVLLLRRNVKALVGVPQCVEQWFHCEVRVSLRCWVSGSFASS